MGIFAFRMLVWAGALLACAAAAPQGGARLPQGLDPYSRRYEAPVANVLQALGQAVRQHMGGAHELALRALPDEAAADLTAVADYALYYRARTLQAQERTGEALQLYRRFLERFPDSRLRANVRLAEAQLRIAGGDPAGALAALGDTALAEDAPALYLRAQALEQAGNRQQATEVYLRIFAEYPQAEEAGRAQKRLQALAPSFLTSRNNYTLLLRRAEKLIDAGRNREARSLLVKLGSVPAPGATARDRRFLLLARADLNLKAATEALRNLKRIGGGDPELAAQALYLEAVAERRLGRESSFLGAREKALRLYPKSPFTEELLYSVAAYFDVEGRIAEAREAYRSVAALFPGGRYHRQALWRAATFSYALGQYRAALEDFRACLFAQNEGESAAAQAYWLARCYAGSGEPAKAAFLYARAEELGGNSYYGRLAAEARAALAASGSVRGNGFSPEFEEIKKRLDELDRPAAALRPPGEAAARVIERACQLVGAGLPDAALEELRSAAERLQEERAIHYVAARIHAAQEDYLNAIVTLRRAWPEYGRLAPQALPPEVWELLFPIKHWKLVSQAAARHGLDPALIMGIIRQESALQERARSSAGARGLMQILPGTGVRVAREARMAAYSTSKLYHPETNIELGVRYLASLLKRYDGKTEAALAAYNAGESRVDRWMKAYAWEDMATFVELIPFSETRAYVKLVLTNQAHYRLRVSSAPSATAP